MSTIDPPPGYNFEHPWLNPGHPQYRDPNPPSYGQPGPTGATGPTGPPPNPEEVEASVRKNMQPVLLDLLAGASDFDDRVTKIVDDRVRKIIREELEAVGLKRPPPTHDENGKCLHRDAHRTPTHEDDGTWYCPACHTTY